MFKKNFLFLLLFLLLINSVLAIPPEPYRDPFNRTGANLTSLFDFVYITGKNISADYFIGDGRYITNIGDTSIWNRTDGVIYPRIIGDNLSMRNESIFNVSNIYISHGGNLNGTYKFNGGWETGGISIIGGDILTQNLYAINITGLNITKLNVNGSLMPYFDNQFDIGNSTYKWRSGNFYNLYSQNGTFYNKVGIGTSTPEERLHILDGIKQEFNSTPKINGYINSTIIDGAFGLFVKGSYAYVTGRDSNSLAVIDVSNSTSPRIIGNISNSSIINSPYSVYVSGSYAYVTGRDSNSLAVIDVSNSSYPTITGYIQNTTLLNQPYGVFVSGSYAYVASGGTSDALVIIDISNPSSPQITGYIQNSTYIDGAFNLYVKGKYAYVTGADSDSLAIIDISNPSSPQITGYYVDSLRLDIARGIFVSGSYAYVTGQNTDSFVVLNISNPSSPQFIDYFVGSSVINDPIGNIYVYGKYAYVTGSGLDTFSVLDVSNPSDTKLINYLNSPFIDEPTNVFISGRYAYVTASNSDSLAVIDILGAELTNIDSVNIRTGSLDVSDYAMFGSSIDVRNGISGDNLFIRNVASIGEIFNVYNKSVGIGTLTPSQKLDVIGNIKLNDTLSIYDSTGSSPATFISSDRLYYGGKALDIGNNLLVLKNIFASSDDGIYITDNAFNLGVFINDSGFVGIGHNTPTSWLDVKSSDENSSSLRIRNGTAPTSPNYGDIWGDNLSGLYYYDTKKNNLFVGREVIVNSLSDFPTPVAGKINLVDGTKYLLNQPIVSPYSFVLPTNASGTITIQGSVFGSTPLIYVGIGGNMFEAINHTGFFKLHDMLLLCPNGTAFNITGQGQDSSYIHMTNAGVVQSDRLGYITNSSFSLVWGGFFDYGDGFVFNNSGGLFQNANIILGKNRNTTIFTIDGNSIGFQFLGSQFTPQPNETMFDIKQTFNSSRGILINDNIFYSGSKIFANSSKKQRDNELNVDGNTNLADSTANALSYFLDNAITTSIPSLNTYYLINATWTNETSERFNFLTNGTFVYTGLEDIQLNIQLITDIDPAVSSTNWRLAVFKNGQIINNTIDPAFSPTGALVKSVTFGSTSAKTGDYFNARISRTSSSGDVVVVNGKLSLSKV